MEESVAAVKQPALALLDGDAGVPARVAEQRHEHDLGLYAGQYAHALKAEPVVAFGPVLDPFRAVRPVHGDVALAFAQARFQRGPQLRREHVHLGLGEVRQPAGVVDVEMRSDDLADVARIEAERAHLLDRRLGLARLRSEERVEDQPELARVAHVVEPEARIDQDEPVGALDEQAVADDLRLAEHASLAADQPSAVRAHRAAAEVVDRVRRAHAAEPTPTGATPSSVSRASNALIRSVSS